MALCDSQIKVLVKNRKRKPCDSENLTYQSDLVPTVPRKYGPQVDWWRFRRERSRSNIKENTLVMQGNVVCMPADEASGRVSLSLARVKGS
jgi:hypothetical protein